MSVRLTQTVMKSGCAAKVAALELRQILQKVKFPPIGKEVLIDGSGFDDASAYLINDSTAMIQTLDFFTPIVDDPFEFGRIAAANSMSDIYAMGARPATSLAILAFPLASFAQDTVTAILQGASEQIALSKSYFLGGHTIDDDTLKFGLSVTGLCHPQKIWSNQGAQTGDHLILTKALGTGTLTAALKSGELDSASLAEVTSSMAQLNNIMDYLTEAQLGHIHAATDITGFGFLGHAGHIAKGSKKSLAIDFAALPKFTQALSYLEKGFLTKAHRTNRDYAGQVVQYQKNLSPEQEKLLFDPQTSGGLLLSVSPEASQSLLDSLKKHFPQTTQVGQITPLGSHLLSVY